MKNRNYLPPLLRGIGTSIVLLATTLSVIMATDRVRDEHIKRAAARAQAETAAKAQPVEERDMAELVAQVHDLQSGAEEESMTDEVIENPWFKHAGFLGTATIAGSFFVEAYLRRRETNQKQ